MQTINQASNVKEPRVRTLKSGDFSPVGILANIVNICRLALKLLSLIVFLVRK